MAGKPPNLFASDRYYIMANSAPAPPPSTCRLWLRSTTTKMHYGNACRGGKRVYAHRLAYAAFKGSPDGWKVLHTCDTPTCVNPEHLYLGTDKDNSHDRTVRGRGSKPPPKQRYLDPAEVRASLARGATKPELADLYGVNLSTIYNTIKRR